MDFTDARSRWIPGNPTDQAIGTIIWAEKGSNNGIDGKCDRRGEGERSQSAEMDGCVGKLFRPEELMEQLNASDGLIGHCHKNGVKFA